MLELRHHSKSDSADLLSNYNNPQQCHSWDDCRPATCPFKTSAFLLLNYQRTISSLPSLLFQKSHARRKDWLTKFPTPCQDSSWCNIHADIEKYLSLMVYVLFLKSNCLWHSKELSPLQRTFEHTTSLDWIFFIYQMMSSVPYS